jgi:tRNA threonylcarbamoyl adenosine modification protein (Sua5/YciO/YrdC/YwlC family)
VTKVIQTTDRAGYTDAVKTAAQILESGGIVGIPTETVYGLAASAEHSGAIERLRDIKGRPEEKKFTICLALKSDAARFAAKLPRAAEKLINRLWPGPLTLVVPGKSGGTVGLRMPGLAITRDILLKADTTVVIPSANPGGQEPATSAREVLDYFEGKIDLVIDAGKSPLGVASTVVEISAEGAFRVLRKGAISQEEIRRAVVRTILFVCTGNLCRSPMAAGIAKRYLADRLGTEPRDLEEAGYRIVSAGTAALAGTPASPEAVRVMKELNIDISSHRSQPLTIELTRDADEIFVMSPHHIDAVREIDSSAAARTWLITPDGSEVPDPIGSSDAIYRRVRDKLRDAILERLEEI